MSGLLIWPGASEYVKGLCTPHTIILDDPNFVVCFFSSFQNQSGFGSEVKGVEQTHALRSIHYTFFTCCVCEKNALSESIL